ncbi:uncharacterized protein CDAR_546851 [Caerostris darwini]|uniref:Uncharacterized protein n=1 Tax=Caerostris darwini TaxID=1538125 RepID=A0AAV4W8W8_9ARAC|nr:uncharacterized protein CDAR_546851 [Caerostris darwini]
MNRKKSFDMFLKERYSDVAAKYTFLSSQQIKKRILDMWKKMSQTSENSKNRGTTFNSKTLADESKKSTRSAFRSKTWVPLKVDVFPAPIKGVLKSKKQQSADNTRHVTFNSDPEIHYRTASETSSASTPKSVQNRKEKEKEFHLNTKMNDKSYSCTFLKTPEEKSEAEKKFDELLNEKCSWSYKSIKTIQCQRQIENKKSSIYQIQSSTIETVNIAENLCDDNYCEDKEFGDNNGEIKNEKKYQRKNKKKQPRKSNNSRTIKHKNSLINKNSCTFNKILDTNIQNDVKTTRTKRNVKVISYEEVSDVEYISSSSDEGIVLQSRIFNGNSDDDDNNSIRSDDDEITKIYPSNNKEELNKFTTCNSFNSNCNSEIPTQQELNENVSNFVEENNLDSERLAVIDQEDISCKNSSIEKVMEENVNTSTLQLSSLSELDNNENEVNKDNRENKTQNSQTDLSLKILQQYNNISAEIQSVCNELETPKSTIEDEILEDFLNGSFDINKYKLKIKTPEVHQIDLNEAKFENNNKNDSVSTVKKLPNISDLKKSNKIKDLNKNNETIKSHNLKNNIRNKIDIEKSQSDDETKIQFKRSNTKVQKSVPHNQQLYIGCETIQNDNLQDRITLLQSLNFKSHSKNLNDPPKNTKHKIAKCDGNNKEKNIRQTALAVKESKVNNLINTDTNSLSSIEEDKKCVGNSEDEVEINFPIFEERQYSAKYKQSKIEYKTNIYDEEQETNEKNVLNVEKVTLKQNTKMKSNKKNNTHNFILNKEINSPFLNKYNAITPYKKAGNLLTKSETNCTITSNLKSKDKKQSPKTWVELENEILNSDENEASTFQKCTFFPTEELISDNEKLHSFKRNNSVHYSEIEDEDSQDNYGIQNLVKENSITLAKSNTNPEITFDSPNASIINKVIMKMQQCTSPVLMPNKGMSQIEENNRNPIPTKYSNLIHKTQSINITTEKIPSNSKQLKEISLNNNNCRKNKVKMKAQKKCRIYEKHNFKITSSESFSSITNPTSIKINENSTKKSKFPKKLQYTNGALTDSSNSSTLELNNSSSSPQETVLNSNLSYNLRKRKCNGNAGTENIINEKINKMNNCKKLKTTLYSTEKYTTATINQMLNKNITKVNKSFSNIKEIKEKCNEKEILCQVQLDGDSTKNNEISIMKTTYQNKEKCNKGSYEDNETMLSQMSDLQSNILEEMNKESAVQISN